MKGKRMNRKKRTQNRSKGRRSVPKRTKNDYRPKGKLALRLRTYNFQKFMCDVVHKVSRREREIYKGAMENLGRAITTYVD